jgi:DNA-binding transcriptional ArsR family regulator
MLALMANDTSSPSTAISGATTSIPSQFAADPVKLLIAIADPIRWAVLRELAAGPPRSVLELAARVRHSDNLVSKHLHWLREAGAVVVLPMPGTDQRISHYGIPPEYLHQNAAGKMEIDYGVCVLRFP